MKASQKTMFFNHKQNEGVGEHVPSNDEVRRHCRKLLGIV
jgi:hypothetical protein